MLSIRGTQFYEEQEPEVIELVTEGRDTLQKIEEVTRYGKGFDGSGLLTVLNHKTCTLNGEVTCYGIGSRVEALAFGNIIFTTACKRKASTPSK